MQSTKIDDEMIQRIRTLTRKGLLYKIETTRREACDAHRRLKTAMWSLEECEPEGIKDACKTVKIAMGELQSLMNELVDLYGQDTENSSNPEAVFSLERETLDRARVLLQKRERETDRLSEVTSSRKSKSSASSSARLRAIAAAAAAKEQAEFERIMAEKENEWRLREVEEQSRRDRERAQHDRDMALLAVNKKLAVANARLRATEEAIEEENERKSVTLPGTSKARVQDRTAEWVHSDLVPGPQHVESEPRRDLPPHPTALSSNLIAPGPNLNIGREPNSFPYCTSTPMRDTTGSQLIETLTLTNQQIVSSLAKQNLPKCHPDTFNGDVTLFHPWKKAFKAMLSNTDLSAEQEINYLRKFTSGNVQRMVDNFRKRQHRDPMKLLESLWSELEMRFGSPAVITNALLERLHESAMFNENENVRLQEFADVCADVDSQIESLPGLECLNFPNAIRPIIQRLPPSLRSKWEKEVATYAEKHRDAYPGFHALTQVVKKQARIKNHPNIIAGGEATYTNRRRSKLDQRRVLATSTTRPLEHGAKPQPAKSRLHCLYHKRDGHNLEDCKAFREKSLEEKTDWIQTAGLCFLCLKQNHRARDCNSKVSCNICGDNRHIALLHKEKPEPPSSGEASEGEIVNNKCTIACRGRRGGMSCSKIVLVDIHTKARPNLCKRVYAIIDDQSNTSLISSELSDEMGAKGPSEKYFLSTCYGNNEVKYGRRISGLVVRSIQNGSEADLPTLVECDNIPDDKSEIPTPEIARRFPHLRDIADEIPPLDDNAGVHLLLGRDAPELLKVRAFKNGPKGAPWAQKLLVGWTMSGQACLDLVDRPVHIQSRKTTVGNIYTETSTPNIQREEGKGSFLDGEEYKVVQCPNKFKLTDSLMQTLANNLKNDVFYAESSDNEIGLSVEDRKFLKIMDEGIIKNELGNWEMPLPFRRTEVCMPNNKSQAMQRFNSLLRTFSRKPQMKRDYVEFMEKIISKAHASEIPNNEIEVPNGQVWYLPHFGVYHPKKPTQIRVVFDSSAEYDHMSLNKELLSGPDLTNRLTGVLIRFRREAIAVMCDIEQMYHSFHVTPKHRNFLRFMWFKDNDPQNSIIEYRMNVHLFGNGPSPAVATFGLRKTVNHRKETSREVKEFVNRNFYVDDGLTSTPTSEQTISLVTETQRVLATANLRLHKVVSNSIDVMEAFPTADRAKDLRDLDLTRDSLPAQRSLGIYWDLGSDSFTFRVTPPERPFTRRGVLSVINSVYDPLGLAAPVVIIGKQLLQKLVIMGKRAGSQSAPLGWDDPLPEQLMDQWQRWKEGLLNLESVSVPRCYRPKEFKEVKRAELHAFGDASQDAVAAAVYLRFFNPDDTISMTLVYGQAKVAPVRQTSIPRLELCGAVMTAQAAARVLQELDMEISRVVYYTDSQAVLGYITNETRRFYIYVGNRVQIIRSLSSPNQWRYIESERNPADPATRGIHSTDLQESVWLNGPDFLKTSEEIPAPCNIIIDDDDPEVRKEVITAKTKVKTERQRLGTERFKRFSSLVSLRRSIALLIWKARVFKQREGKSPTHSKGTQESAARRPSLEELEMATNLILREAQMDGFEEQLQQRENVQTKKKAGSSQVDSLSPFVDGHGILRVGGRLRNSSLETKEKHPALLPKNHHLSVLLVRHYHEKVHHQGRQITCAALRQGGYWLIGAHRLVSKELNNCVICRKLRGAHLNQRMADLPADRTEEVPPFTNVGFDVFGPWYVSTRRTRGAGPQLKRWGLVFTCLNSRALHIEILESMDASSFICALRRFFALRGPAALLRCDRGTNFVGGKSELEAADKEKIEKFVVQQGFEWKFNPPHASHFGGVWERQISTIRRVLGGMFAELGHHQLTHELLTTLMSEVTAIVNARPIASIPTDTDDPQPLSPHTILTMKTRPLAPPSGEFLPPDLYARRRWRRVQYLAEQFWTRWRREYLQSLQAKNKWHHKKRNLAVGDVVLVRDEERTRNDWPLGRVVEAHESDDGIVRKATVMVRRGEEMKTKLRPIKELVLLVPMEEQA